MSSEIETKEKLLRQMSEFECPLCKNVMYVGSVSLENQTPALFCRNCSLRIAVKLEIII